MKKTAALLVSLIMILSSFTACDKKEESKSDKNSSGSSSAPAPSDKAAAGSQTNGNLPIADNAVDFAANMKLGWNLGNTLDANGSNSLESETSWGQPMVTKQLIDYIKEAGFTSIRIPVSWGNHTDSDFNIDSEWMSRVTEIVDYALDDGLYVIINSHHDCDYYYPTEEHYADSEKYLKAIWAQIADNFKDYDERLVFESMNEPRLMGTRKEWWFADNDPVGIASIECIVKQNQVFVDTVRAAGGYNESRYLMVPSNAAAPQNALNGAFTMPSDPSNRLIVSVHAYTPYDFAMNENGYTEWDGSKLYEFDFMDKLSEKFTANGYGIAIGEFGATNKANPDDRVAWAKDYTSKAASLGISCFLWDNGGTSVGTENFGMIDRYTLTVYYPDILSEMTGSYK